MSQNKIKLHIPRLMAALLCAILVYACALTVHADGENGSCGDNLTWTLTEGTLKIKGSGAMWDFLESTMAPWYEQRAEIRNLILPDGLTHVGELAFYDCSRLTIVNLPDNVESIGDFAFASCEKLKLLDLGDGLRTIGKSAFHGCWELTDVRLSQSLQSIGEQAFYDCASITNIVIPAGVEKLGTAAFAYCTSLVRAEIQTSLKILPEWTFFGCTQLNTLILPATIEEMENAALRDCDNLSTVSYGGDSLTMEQLKDVITEDVPGFGSTGFVTNENPGSSASAGSAVENSDGSISEQITTVTSGNNSSVISTVDRTFGNQNGDTISSDITVSIENDDGWEEAIQNVQNAIEELNGRVQPGVTLGTTNVTVYIKDSEKISDQFVESFAGSNVKLTVVSKDGSSWKIDCSTMKKKEFSGAYNLRYTVEPADADALELMGVTQGYRIHFVESAVVETEVLIALPDSAMLQTATFFRRDDKKNLTRFQSVQVDNDGYAHLYLGSVDGDTDYYLGINVPEAEAVDAADTSVSDTIIPDTMQHAYPKMDYVEPIRYEITGRSSSWGMNLGQVMGIMAAVMVGVIVIVCMVVYMWNKRRVRSGYVPGWDDMDDEDDDD